MLRHGELDALSGGTFELTALHCQVKRKHSTAEALVGPALVRQDRDKHLYVTIFLATAVPEPPESLSKTGEIIADEEYFEITLQDIHGRKWTCDYVLGHLAYDSHLNGTVLSGRIAELVSIEEAAVPQNQATLALEVLTGLSVPANAPSITETRAGSFSERKMRLCRAKADVQLGKVEIELREQSATVRLSSAEKLAENVELRLLEALQFVAAHRVEPAVSRLSHANRKVTRIISRGLMAERRRGLPPLQDTHQNSRDNIWLMFTKYFNYVIEDPSLEFHPISLSWHRVLGVESTSLETQALVYSVAVEEIVKMVTVTLTDPVAVKAEKSTIRQWISAVSSFLTKEKAPKDISTRFTNQLNNLLGRRVVDTLYDMAAAEMVREELIRSWKDLRDISAHGAIGKYKKIEEVLRSRDATLVLMHQIIFSAIGYEGLFTDYSQSGWPACLYPLQPTSE